MLHACNGKTAAQSHTLSTRRPLLAVSGCAHATARTRTFPLIIHLLALTPLCCSRWFQRFAVYSHNMTKEMAEKSESLIGAGGARGAVAGA